MTGLYVSALSISHFRSHQRGELALDGRPVAVFGPNGAGKTNLLEAVSLLSPGRGLRRAAAEEMARRPEALGWKLRFILAGAELDTEVEIFSDAGAARQVKLGGKAAAQAALGQLLRVLWLVPSMDRLWIEGAEGRRRFLDRMTLSFFPDHGAQVLVYDKAMRERNRLLKEQVRDGHWYLALERQMARAGAQMAQNRAAALARLLAAQEGAETAFPAAHLEIIQAEGAQASTEADLLAAFGESRFRDMAAGRSLVGPHRTDLHAVYAAKGVAAKDCSTGEQKALLVSLILANARALAADLGAPPLVLLDEVGAHLDAARRAALYDEICALGAQAWMTGTGPELFQGMGARAQYVEMAELGGVSELRMVSAPQAG